MYGESGEIIKIVGFANSVLAATPVIRVRDVANIDVAPATMFCHYGGLRGTQKRYMFDAVKSRSLTRSTFVPRE